MKKHGNPKRRQQPRCPTCGERRPSITGAVCDRCERAQVIFLETFQFIAGL